MPNKTTPQKGMQQNRTIDLAVREVKNDERRVTVSFSSEQAVDRWYGLEVLSHDDGCVDLTRLNDIGVSLFNHDRSYVLGKIENASIDVASKRCTCDIVFDADPEADKIFQKVQSGTLKGVSVGYSVDNWEEVAAGKMSTNGRFAGPCYVAVRWAPFEVSIVSIPADDTVGVGRELESTETVPVINRTDISNEEDERTMANPNTNSNANTNLSNQTNPQNADLAAERQAAIAAERQRVNDISDLCREFEIPADEYIRSDLNIDQVRTKVLERLKEQRKPSAVGSGVIITADEVDKFRSAASDSILLRAGKVIEKPSDGARDLRGMKLRDLAIECLARSGVANAYRFDNDRLYREALTPDGQFAAILSDSVNKSMATAYKAANTTFESWTAKGSNPDFKASTHYQISEAGDLTKMTQSGEFTFDEMKDNGVSKAIATFGKSWGITRQALINDDIGVLTRIPEAYVRASKRGINKLVYQMIGNNPKIYDNKQLFHNEHNNIGSTPGGIGTNTIGNGRMMMRKQKNLRGKETLNIAPTYLIVPSTLETDAEKFLLSLSDPESQNSGVVNIFRNSLTLVVDAELDSYSEKAWYLAANPSDIDTVEVTYLNGDEAPKVESAVGFDFLGMKFRIYIDYGVTVLDYRGLHRNNGQ